MSSTTGYKLDEAELTDISAIVTRMYDCSGYSDG